MSVVHVFVSTGRFGSHRALRAFVDPTYTEVGAEVPSQFMREAGVRLVEPACIEVEVVAVPQPLQELMAGASYASHWLSSVGDSIVANEVICVFEPNEVAHPGAASTVTYCGAFEIGVP